MASNAPRPTKSERLESARIEARAKREAAEKQRQRRSLWLKISIIVGVLAIVAGGVTWAVVANKANNTFAEQGPIPAAGNEWGGIVLDSTSTVVKGKGGEVDINTVKDAQRTSETAAPQGVVKDAKPAQIIIYADVLCPHCAQFEQQYASSIEKHLTDKSATVEYRMVSVISSSSNYPARGANALFCAVEKNPASFVPMMKALFADPKEYSNAELSKFAADNGAADINSCVSNGTYRPYAAIATGKMAEANVGGTPSVFVNGEYWDGEKNPDFTAWLDEKVAAANK